ERLEQANRARLCGCRALLAVDLSIFRSQRRNSDGNGDADWYGSNQRCYRTEYELLPGCVRQSVPSYGAKRRGQRNIYGLHELTDSGAKNSDHDGDAWRGQPPSDDYDQSAVAHEFFHIPFH